MTAPKQELWIHSVRHRLDVRFLAGVGAVFDFYAGRIKRPPPVVEKMGLEWLSRLVQEPRRLWRRTLVSAPVFVSHVVRERMRMGSIHDRERPLHAKKKAK
jgi:N-acetylglucosaminyldiphosphoundecaprenol N-acetyl-beta-D-mannosaminyltransferase